MEHMKTHNQPQISDQRAVELSKGLDITLLNKRAGKHGDVPAIMDGKNYVDTAFSFTDKRYLDIQKRFSGKVLILGLGFGSSILHACANPDVTKVTVVEMRIEVIRLFWKFHGREFNGNQKLWVHLGDALEWDHLFDYDHVFIDLYHTPFRPPFSVEKYDHNMKILLDRFKNSITHYINLYG